MTEDDWPLDPLDRLEDAAVKMVTRGGWEQQNRLGLLWTHAIIGILAGGQMLAWGSATSIENVVGVWSRVVMGLLGILGGLLLAWGLTRRPRSVPFEVAGLAIIGVWDLAMLLGLAAARWRQGDFSVRGLLAPLPEGYVVAYPTSVYGGLFALVCIHLWTLRNLHRHGLKRG